MTNEEQILKQRAKIIAMRHEWDAAPQKAINVVEFLLFNEKYAVEVQYVKEVFSLHEITPIPGTPESIMGVINFRGGIVSVVNLKVLFGLKEKGLTEMNKVILLTHENMAFGLIADGILGSSELFEHEITEPPITLSPGAAKYVKGVSGKNTILLNAAALLQSKALQINQ